MVEQAEDYLPFEFNISETTRSHSGHISSMHCANIYFISPILTFFVQIQIPYHWCWFLVLSSEKITIGPHCCLNCLKSKTSSPVFPYNMNFSSCIQYYFNVIPKSIFVSVFFYRY